MSPTTINMAYTKAQILVETKFFKPVQSSPGPTQPPVRSLSWGLSSWSTAMPRHLVPQLIKNNSYTSTPLLDLCGLFYRGIYLSLFIFK